MAFPPGVLTNEGAGGGAIAGFGGNEPDMISEWRKLTFSMDELAIAIMSHLQSTGKIGDKDRLGKITIKDPKSAAVSVTIHRGPDGGSGELELNPETVGAVMMAHCIRKKIPLPRRAKKSIAAGKDGLMLIIELD
jgi:hypothetical protein